MAWNEPFNEHVHHVFLQLLPADADERHEGRHQGIPGEAGAEFHGADSASFALNCAGDTRRFRRRSPLRSVRRILVLETQSMSRIFAAATVALLRCRRAARAEPVVYTWTGTARMSRQRQSARPTRWWSRSRGWATTSKGRFQQEGRPERVFQTTLGRNGAIKTAAMVGGGGMMDVIARSRTAIPGSSSTATALRRQADEEVGRHSITIATRRSRCAPEGHASPEVPREGRRYGRHAGGKVSARTSRGFRSARASVRCASSKRASCGLQPT